MKKTINRAAALILCAMSLLFLLPQGVFASSDYDYYNDAVFLGDSLTVGLEKYVSSQRKAGSNVLGNAQFLATNGYMVSQTANEDGFEKHPEYDGNRLQPQKSIKAMNVKKVFITLGINDSAGEVSTLINNYAKLIDAIRNAVPEAQLFMIAVFPMTVRKESSLRNNEKIDTINRSLMKLAISADITFIDFTCVLKSGNALNKDYSSDDYVHFNNDGYVVWIAQMKAFAKFAQKTASSSDGVKVVNVKSYVNGREKASSESALVAKVPKGAGVDVIEQADASWYKVIYDGAEMYIHKKYLSISGTSDLSGKVVNVSEYANLRKTPSEDGEMFGTAEKDATLPVSRKYYNPEWYRIRSGEDNCYISESYLKLG